MIGLAAWIGRGAALAVGVALVAGVLALAWAAELPRLLRSPIEAVTLLQS